MFNLFKKKKETPVESIEVTQNQVREEVNSAENNGHLFLFTSHVGQQDLKNALVNFEIVEREKAIEIPSVKMKIKDGDYYFLKQREGMLNFYSMLINPEYIDVHSKFLMHLSSCVKGYEIHYEDEALMTPLVNDLVEHLNGLIFLTSMEFYTKDWQLIIDSSGGCDLTN